MDVTCQHCGQVASDRVMCPNCGRRMQAKDAAPSGSAAEPTQPPAADYQPPAGASPLPPYAAPPTAPPYAAPPSAPPYAAAPAGYGYAPPAEVGAWGGPLSPVLLLDRRATTSISRVTVLFRYILAIPHFVILGVLGIAQLFVLIAAWFAALFTAKVPDGMYRFLSWVHGYQARVSGYLYLLTDKWPTIGADEHYPIATRFPGPSQLNRAAVFFRYFLNIPAALLTILISFGFVVLSFPIWLIVLIKGRVPESIFDSLARVLRYQVRDQAYYAMLTSAYPSGLFGEDPPLAELPPPAEYTLEPIRNSGGARKMMITFIVLGSLAFVGYIALFATLAGKGDTIDANNTLVHKYNSVRIGLEAPPACASTDTNCYHQYAVANANRLQDFTSTVNGIDFNGKYPTEVAEVKSATATLSADYAAMVNAASPTDFNAAFLRARNGDLVGWETAVISLNRDLLTSVGQGDN